LFRSAPSTFSNLTERISGSAARGPKGGAQKLLRKSHPGIAFVFHHACKLGCEGIVSKRLGSPYLSGRVSYWLKIKNPAAPAVKREAAEWRA
jgi:hypothetical protein